MRHVHHGPTPTLVEPQERRPQRARHGRAAPAAAGRPPRPPSLLLPPRLLLLLLLLLLLCTRLCALHSALAPRRGGGLVQAGAQHGGQVARGVPRRLRPAVPVKDREQVRVRAACRQCVAGRV